MGGLRQEIRKEKNCGEQTIARNIWELLWSENKFFLDYIGLRIAMSKPDKQSAEEFFMLDGHADWKKIMDCENTKGLWNSRDSSTEFSKMREFCLKAVGKEDAWKQEWLCNYFGSDAVAYMRFILHYEEYVNFDNEEICGGEIVYPGEVMAYALTLNKYLVEQKNYKQLIQRALALSVEAGQMKNIADSCYYSLAAVCNIECT